MWFHWTMKSYTLTTGNFLPLKFLFLCSIPHIPHWFPHSWKLAGGFKNEDGAIFLTSSSSPYYCWTCCLFVLYVIGTDAPAGLLFPPLKVRQCVFVSAPRFPFYSLWKWSRLSTTSATAGKRTLSLILCAQKLMKQLEIFVISTQNV